MEARELKTMRKKIDNVFTMNNDRYAMSCLVNPAMIIIARKSRGLCTSECAKKIGMTTADLKEIEGLESRILLDDKIIAKLSKALNYPESFFCRSGKMMAITHCSTTL